MDKEKAILIITEVAELAQKNGLLNLNDAVLTYEALECLKGCKE